jgi:hypothetical protein
VGSVASLETGLMDVIKANACILKQGLANAESEDDIELINDNLQDLLNLASGVEDELQSTLGRSTKLMGDLIEKCDGCVASSSLCCVPLYLAADGTRVPAQNVRLEVVEQGRNTPIDSTRTVTDSEGKVYLELEPNKTYIVTMQTNNTWEDETFSVTVDDDCAATVNGAESICCASGCSVTVYRPGFGGLLKTACRNAYIPFAPTCFNTGCGGCMFD